jgi:hypothetical protein
MHASLPKINSHASTDASSSTAGPSSHMLDVGQEDLEEIRKVYEGWAKSVAFEYCDLRSEGEGAEGYRHVFSKGAFSSSSYHFSPNSRPDLSDANPRRALLVAQISSRSPANPSPNDPSPSPKSSPSGLDGSVFLRVDDERVDVLKALVIGPAGTPYENGCYVFDIFLPAE